MELLYGLAALIILVLVLKLLSIPVAAIKWLVVNGVTGLILLFVANLLGANIETSILNALIAGVLGIPGIIILLLIK